MITAKLLKTAQTLYLYADGHAVIIHMKNDKDVGIVDWVTLHETIGVRTMFPDDVGRLIVSRAPAIAMLTKCVTVRPRAPSVVNGSNKTRDLDIAIGHVGFDFGAGTIYVSIMPDLLSGDFNVQADHGEAWADVKDKTYWGAYNVGYVYAKPVLATA